jgi:dCMP deaminase
MDIGCAKNLKNQPSYGSYEFCPAVHAEENAIINSSRADRIGATMFIAGYNADGSIAHAMPCNGCKRKIMNSLIGRVVIVDENESIKELYPDDWAKEDTEWYKKIIETAKSN